MVKVFGWSKRKKQREQDLDDEIRAHLAMAVSERTEQGEDPSEAEANARREFGNVTQVKEVTRDMWGWRWLETLLQDVRCGLRQLRRNPGFTAVAMITLALGIGATTAIFTVIEAVLLRPLPYHDPSRLVLLTDPEYPSDPEAGGFLYKDVQAWKSQSRSFQRIAVYYRDSGYSRVTLTASGEPEFVQGAFVSANFFKVMGVPPLLGRVFTSSEEAHHERVVLLSHGLWVRRFGGSPKALGKRLEINGHSAEVIGIMPETFQFPAPDQQFWAPLTIAARISSFTRKG